MSSDQLCLREGRVFAPEAGMGAEAQELDRLKADFAERTILSSAQRNPNRMLRALRQQLYELLSAAPNGMRLANIPIRFEELFRYKLDPRAYGFPKLLNLLQVMSDCVLVEKKDEGHWMASLREHAEWVIAQANMEEVRAALFLVFVRAAQW